MEGQYNFQAYNYVFPAPLQGPAARWPLRPPCQIRRDWDRDVIVKFEDLAVETLERPIRERNLPFRVSFLASMKPPSSCRAHNACFWLVHWNCGAQFNLEADSKRVATTLKTLVPDNVFITDTKGWVTVPRDGIQRYVVSYAAGCPHNRTGAAGPVEIYPTINNAEDN